MPSTLKPRSRMLHTVQARSAMVPGGRPTQPATFVIFGVTGNLAQHHLLPALYHLIKDNLLDEHTAIVGVSRSTLTVDELLRHVELCVLEVDKVCDPQVLKEFRARLSTIRLNPVVEADYANLRHTLQAIEDHNGVCMNQLFYLSIPPQVYGPVVENLGRQHLNEGCKHHRGVSRLLIEKPFGYDYVSAEDLIRDIAQHFSEEQVFRIDHYLAKETAQNILVFRQQNPAFTSLWDHHHVRTIELEFSETIGVAGRREFYDNIGAMRDVAQNHLLQLLTLAAMELPGKLDNASLHVAKRTLLEAIPAANATPANVIRAQYRGYQAEVQNPGSTTETYVRFQLNINNTRWRGVPVTLMAGKMLATKQTAVTMTFGTGSNESETNQLCFRISPNEGIDITLTVKRPGYDDRTEAVQMNFDYANAAHPDAYERVLIDAVRGDHSLFATSAEVLEAWRIVQPILTAWEQGSDDLRYYEPGSTGLAAT